jgi:S-adenosylmethionine/arginine decarboxylase-like enzyme
MAGPRQLMPAKAAFVHRYIEVTGIAAARLADPDQLGVAVVAAAGALGLSAAGPPVTRPVQGGSSVAHLCREGHIVLRAMPDEGRCLIDMIALSHIPLQRGLDVLARRLGVTLPLP